MTLRQIWLAAIFSMAALPAFASTELAINALQDRAASFGLSATDIADIEITDHYRTRHSGVEHVWLRQRIDGLPVALALTNVNIGMDGRIWSLNSRFAANAASRTAARQPTLSPQQALERYAEERRLQFDESVSLAMTRSDGDFIFHGGAMADGDIPVHLAWLEHQGRLHLAWEVAVDEKGRPDWFNAWIDAHSGEVLKAVNWTQEAGYRVFAEPLEHPGEGEPSFVENPADAQASPLGWHNTGSTQYTDTRGNNVFAQEDRAGNNNPNVPRPDGGTELIFDFPIDLETQQPVAYLDFAVTNLFYWNNLIHDVLWHYGFDEPAGNFQVNNFGLGGLGGDPVRADAQDGSGTNNANFSTPPDGNPPRMQMFVWTGSGSNPARLLIPEPFASAGDYPVATASWGEPIGDPGTTATLELVDDGSANPDEGCEPLQGFTVGNIALVRRGTCEFGLKGLLAQQAGASGVVVINNQPGNATMNMGAGSSGGQVTIPVGMIGLDNGNAVVADLVSEPTGTLLREGGEFLSRDSDLDAGVIAHEYGHGLSIRLTGGPSTSSCLFGSEQAGEGWSDFLGLWLTAKADDQIDQPRGIGSYLIWQENIPGATIRPAPYIRDMSLNPLTYDRVRTAGPGGVSIPHGVGTVYNSILWDLYWNLVEKYGFDEDFHTGSGGNNITMQLVVDALKLQPCGPTFVTNRDATLLADQIAYDGANQCEIWEAFARRGVGVNASDGGASNNISGIVEDFTLPEECETPSEASLQFDQLLQTYDGQPKPVDVTTNPEGLTVVVTYDDEPTPPTDAGSYAVVATVDEEAFIGTASATLVIEPAMAAIMFEDLEQLFTGQPLAPVIITDPPDLDLTVSYDGEDTLPVAVGEYLVEVSSADSNYLGSASTTFTVLSSGPQGLRIIASPSGVNVVNRELAPPLTVEVLDAAGNVLTSDNETTISISVVGHGADIMTGDRMKVAADGVAEFTGLAITEPGVGYVLIAEDELDELDAVTSEPFDVFGTSVFEDRFEQ